MKRIVTGLFLLAFATAAFADGAATFKARCSICHGPEGAGGKIVPRSIKGTPEATVLTMIKKGNAKMKPVTLPDADATAVAKYVAGLK
jgi:mono/diheme cytochrome c family protein